MTATTAAIASPARGPSVRFLLRRAWDGLLSATYTVKLDQHLARDIGIESYEAPVFGGDDRG